MFLCPGDFTATCRDKLSEPLPSSEERAGSSVTLRHPGRWWSSFCVCNNHPEGLHRLSVPAGRTASCSCCWSGAGGRARASRVRWPWGFKAESICGGAGVPLAPKDRWDLTTGGRRRVCVSGCIRWEQEGAGSALAQLHRTAPCKGRSSQRWLGLAGHTSSSSSIPPGPGT